MEIAAIGREEVKSDNCHHGEPLKGKGNGRVRFVVFWYMSSKGITRIPSVCLCLCWKSRQQAINCEKVLLFKEEKWKVNKEREQ